MSDQEPDAVYYSTQTQTQVRRRGCGCNRLLLGGALFAVGLWFLFRNLGYEVPGLLDSLPLFPLLGFLALVASYFRGDRRATTLATGVGGALICAFLLLFTLDVVDGAAMERLWPTFLLLVAVAFFVRWLAAPADKGVLAPAALCAALGVLGFLFTYGVIPDFWLRRGWPVLLILVGLALVVRGYLDRRK